LWRLGHPEPEHAPGKTTFQVGKPLLELRVRRHEGAHGTYGGTML